MATKTRTDDALITTALTSFADGYRVIRKGQRLRADDPVVVAHPEFFHAGASDSDLAAAAGALGRSLMAMDRELPLAEQRRRRKVMRQAKARLAKQRKEHPPIYSGEIWRPKVSPSSGGRAWWLDE
jgi:hypothetical protein